MKKWRLRKTDANIELMCKVLNIDEVTAVVLANRSIRSKKTAIRYLNPELTYLYDGILLKDMEKAVRALKLAVDSSRKIAIYGDYDADGIMSVVILYKMLKEYGAEVIYYIPDREEEGYGLNKQALETLREEEVDLLIACDNGIAALEEADYANKLGIKLIVVDHHEPGYVETVENARLDVIPNCCAVVDPKQQECSYPFKYLCAAGLCYKFAEQFQKVVGRAFDKNKEYLALAAIATVCDIVELLDENRILVKKGLEAINSDPGLNAGLTALIKERGLLGRKITAFDIGFIIGPCINAAGRLESALLAVELFTTKDPEKAAALARRISDLNQERRALTTEAVEKIMEGLGKEEIQDKVIVIYDEDIHESIAGIVAGKIKETYYRPTIVLTKGGGGVKGSARSIEGYDIFAELFKCKDLFDRFGGHAMAAGLSLPKENIPLLRKEINMGCTLSNEDFIETIDIDSELELSQVTYELSQRLKNLEPYGKNNREPIFASKQVQAEQLRIIEEKNTMIFTFTLSNASGRGTRSIKGVCFGREKLYSFASQLAKRYKPADCEKVWAGILRTVDLIMDIAYSVDINEYNNNVSVQLKIVDFILH